MDVYKFTFSTKAFPMLPMPAIEEIVKETAGVFHLS